MEHEEIRTKIDRVRARIEEIETEIKTLDDQIKKLAEENEVNPTFDSNKAEAEARDRRGDFLKDLGQKHEELQRLEKELESLPPETPRQENKRPDPSPPNAADGEDEKRDSSDDGIDTPEARAFMEELLKPGERADEIMLKKPPNQRPKNSMTS